MKKILPILGALLLLGGAAWWLLKKEVLKSPGFKPDASKKQSALDLSPEVIALLQKMVHDGSDGLYKLEIGSLKADLASSSVALHAISLRTDSEGYRKLFQEKSLPDDVYELDCAELRITGLGLGDLLDRKNIAVKSIEVREPHLRLRHQKQPYNKSKRIAEKTQSLYDRLSPYFNSLRIDTIAVSKGNYTDIDGDLHNKQQEFHNISIQAGAFNFDAKSSADTGRFLFTQSFRIKTTDYRNLIGGGDYDFGIGGIELDACGRELRLSRISLQPHGGRAAFQRRHKTQTELYEVELPQLRILGVNWWAALHSEALIAREADITGGKVNIYLDLALPQSGRLKADNFPQQMLMQLGVPVSLRKISVEGGHLSYEEKGNDMPTNGIVRFENFSATAENVTNLPAEVKANPQTTFRGSCLLMGESRMEGTFAFRLPASSRGAFSMNLTTGPMNAVSLNPFAESMGLVRFTSGRAEGGSVQLRGDNARITGTVTARYEDLKLAPLKVKNDDTYRRRPLLQFVYNTVVKNSNPGRNGKLRTGTIDRRRSNEGNFFNFTWLALKDGLMGMIR